MKLPKLQYWCAGCGTIPADAENPTCHCLDDGIEPDFRLHDAETCAYFYEMDANLKAEKEQNKRLRAAICNARSCTSDECVAEVLDASSSKKGMVNTVRLTDAQWGVLHQINDHGPIHAEEGE